MPSNCAAFNSVKQSGNRNAGFAVAGSARLAIRSLLIVLLLVAVGCGEGETSQAGGSGKGKGRGGFGSGPVPVVVARAELKDVPIEIQVVGNVEPYSTVSVRSQVNGQLTQVLFQEGEYVMKDSPMFRIDPRQIDGQLAQAQANLARSKALLAQAEANLKRDVAQQAYAEKLADRYSALAKEGILSQQQDQQSRSQADALVEAANADRAAIESAQAQIEADQANIDNINLQRSYTEIVAPIEGRTGNTSQKAGNIITANNTELAVIQQVQPIYVTFAVPEARLSEVKRYFDLGGSLPVTVHAQDGSDDIEHGQLTFIDSAVDTTTGTIRLKGTFQNPRRNLWPGQFVNVTLRLTTRRDSVVIPNEAVQTGQEGNFVYVVDDDHRVEARPVVLGPRLDLDMVIDEGLAPGEIVVTEGQLRLQPGSQVEIRGAGPAPMNSGGPQSQPASGEVSTTSGPGQPSPMASEAGALEERTAGAESFVGQ